MVDQLAFVKRTFEVLRDAFRGVAARHDQCHCRWNIAEDSYRDRTAGKNSGDWRHEHVISTRHLELREPDIRFVSPNERAQILQDDPNAQFEVNSAREQVYYRVPGISSTMHFRGDHGARDQFMALANDAGCCLLSFLERTDLNLKLPALVPYDAIAAVKSRSVSTDLPSNLAERWVALLHVLGWQSVPFSPLWAQRMVWHEHTSFTGDPEELHKFVGSVHFRKVAEHIPFPPRFFASTLSSDVNIASVYAIDVLLAGLVAAPVIDPKHFEGALAELPAGADKARAYHSLVRDILSLIFEPDLHSPTIEAEINEGRGRIDIMFLNAAANGYFADIAFRHAIKCPVVFFECKNYSSDIGPPEYAQLVTRFGDKRGNVGFIVCRTVENCERATNHCRDRFQAKHEHIIVLDDRDLIAMLELKAKGDSAGVSQYLHDKFRPIFMGA
jgi:hypothetical protein